MDGGQVYYNSRVVEDQLPALFRSITITESDRSKLREELDRLFEAEVDDNEELKRAEARLVKLERMEKNLQRLALEEEISFEDLKEYRLEIEAKWSRLKTTGDAIR